MRKIRNLIWENSHVILSVLFALVLFRYEFGFAILRFTNDEWLFSGFFGADSVQHYAGWLFYRNSPWTWPLSLAKNMGYPNGVSIAFTDSIPLFGIFFKCFSAVLPETFQYFGLFLLLSFVLQAFYASRLLRLFTDRKTAFAGSCLFVLSPSLFHRVFCHTSLTAHWVITAALYLAVKMVRQREPSCIPKFMLLSMAAVLIHPYFFPMVFGIFLITEIRCEILYRRPVSAVSLVRQAAWVGAIIAVIAANGMLIRQKMVPAGGYGDYAAALNAMCYPRVAADFSSWSAIRSGSPLQYFHFSEGFAYAGMGVLCGFLIALAGFLLRRTSPLGDLRKTLPFLIIFAVYFLFAVSNDIHWNDQTLVKIPMPELFYRFADIFRSSGRFMWIPVYLVTAYGAAGIARNFPKTGFLIAAALVCLQIVDLTPGLKAYHDFSRQRKEPPAYEADGAWLEFPRVHDKFIVFNNHTDYLMASYIAREKMKTNMIFSAAIYQFSALADQETTVEILLLTEGETLTMDSLPYKWAVYLLPESYAHKGIDEEVLSVFRVEQGRFAGKDRYLLVPIAGDQM